MVIADGHTARHALAVWTLVHEEEAVVSVVDGVVEVDEGCSDVLENCADVWEDLLSSDLVFSFGSLPSDFLSSGLLSSELLSPRLSSLDPFCSELLLIAGCISWKLVKSSLMSFISENSSSMPFWTS